MRLATVLAVGSALLVGGIAAAPAGAGTGSGNNAVAAKKKCKKKKCKKSPVFKALAGRSLNATIPNSSPTPAGSERYDFCRNGTYFYKKADYGSGGTFFQTTYRGSWKVISSQGNSSGLAGSIQYSVTSFVSIFSDGAPAESPPPAILSQSITFGPFGVSFAGNTFLFGPAAC